MGILRAGGYASAAGLLVAWATDRPLSSPLPEIAEALQLLLLASGALLMLTGCAVFTAKGLPSRVALAGAVASTVLLGLVPWSASLLHFNPNVHDWTGLLFFLWLLACLVSPLLFLAGAVRLLLQRRRDRRTGP